MTKWTGGVYGSQPRKEGEGPAEFLKRKRQEKSKQRKRRQFK